MPTATGRKKQPRRERTEEKILDAFERVMLRDGAHKISVLSISREAGVAKTLIYKYYDGLVGLIKAWFIRRKQWPELKDLYSDEQARAYSENPLEYQKQSLRRMAEQLKSNPLLLEVMMAELLGSGPVTTALRELRAERLKEDSEILAVELSTADVPGKPTLRIFYAAMSYLVLRARSSPEYMGTLHLDQPGGWNEVMGDFEHIFDDLIAFEERKTRSAARRKTKDKKP